MKVALGIPFWGEDAWRLKNFKYVFEHVRHMFPFEDIYVEHDEAYTRGGSRNKIVEMALEEEMDLVVLCDADTFPEETALYEAVAAAYLCGGLHFPYDSFQLLTPAGTNLLLAGESNWTDKLEARGPGSLGGCMVVRPVDWMEAGASPELDGWGFEDVIFAIQSRNFIRANEWHPGTVTCLWHPNECKPDSEQYTLNINICKKVEALDGNPIGLRKYMNGSPWWPGAS